MVVILLWMFAGVNSLVIEKGDRLKLDYSSTDSDLASPILTYASRSATSCFVQCLQMSCDSVIYCGVSSTCSLYRAREHILNVNDVNGNPDRYTYIKRKNVCENGKFDNGVCKQYIPFQTLVSDSYTLMFESGNYNTNDLLRHRNVILGYKLGLRLKVAEMIIFSDGTNLTRSISPTVIGMGSDFIQEQVMYLVLLLPDKSINPGLIKQNEILASNGKKISLKSSTSTPKTMETSLQWFMKQPNGTVECHSRYSNGEMNGTISDCLTAIQNGAELYVVTSSLAGPVTVEILNTGSLEYSFPLHLDFVQVDGEDFKPYNDSVSWSVVVGRSNETLITRATVKMTGDRPHTTRNDEENVQYFINTGWNLVYSVNYDRQILSGNINDLKNAVLSGRRVRVKSYDSYERSLIFTLNSIYVVDDESVNGKPTAYPQTNNILQASRPNLQYADFDTYGRISMCILEVGNPTAIAGEVNMERKLEWFVESRPWSCVMKTDQNQAISFGNIGDLKQAVLSQKDFRLIIIYSLYKLVVEVTEARFYEDGTFVFQFGPMTRNFETCQQATGVITETMIVQLVKTIPFDTTNSGSVEYITGAIEWYIS